MKKLSITLTILSIYSLQAGNGDSKLREKVNQASNFPHAKTYGSAPQTALQKQSTTPGSNAPKNTTTPAKYEVIN